MNQLKSVSQKSTLLALSAVLVAGLLGASADAEARGRSHGATRSGPNGGMMQRSVDVQAGDGQRSALRQAQGPNGASRSVERGYDAASGQAYHEVNSTGPNGQTHTRSGSTQWGDGAYSHSGTATGPNGQSRSTSGQGQYGDGSYSRSRTVDTPAGSASTTASGSYDAATGTATRQLSKLGPNGGSVVRESTVSRGAVQ